MRHPLDAETWGGSGRSALCRIWWEVRSFTFRENDRPLEDPLSEVARKEQSVRFGGHDAGYTDEDFVVEIGRFW
ncbi:MAG: hypothetical protein WCJ64_18980 [Rhodospirillaceae bacterium]